MKLSEKTLGGLNPDVGVPKYDRAALRPGIIHIGVGNFHRSHQAVYINELLNAGGDPAWGIQGAGVRQPDVQMREMLSAQDWLFSVVEVDGDNLNASVIGGMMDFLPVDPAANAPVIAAMTNPETKIVSLTITEGGYFVDASTGTFNVNHPDIAADVTSPTHPKTVFGAILAALVIRRTNGTAPFTVMSCDNLPGNGDITRDAVVTMARAIDPDLAHWVQDNVTFPNGMVDRITPATGDRERGMLQSVFGFEDTMPVFCEPFRQWVLEDKFVNGRPALEKVGVTFTGDIHPFEKMKIRMLNGGHAIMAYPSALLGIEFAHEAMATPLIRDFLRKVLTDDVMAFVPDVPGFTPGQYLDSICTRFANPGVADTIRRLCHDGSNRQPKFVIPSVNDNLAGGHTPYGLALSCALWCQYCAGRNDQGDIISDNDPNWAKLHETAIQAQTDARAWLAQDEIYGKLGNDQRFLNAFSSALKSLGTVGTEMTIRSYLRDANKAAG